MKTLKITVSGLALCFAGASFAGTASPISVEPVSIAAPVAWSGGIDVGYGLTARTSTDSAIENSPFGGYSVGGYLARGLAR